MVNETDITGFLAILQRALSFLNAIYMRGDKRILNSLAKAISRKKKKVTEKKLHPGYK